LCAGRLYQIVAYERQNTPDEAWSGSHDPFFKKNLPQLYLCKIGEARHFKVRVLIDTEEYEYDVLLPKWMCSVM